MTIGMGGEVYAPSRRRLYAGTEARGRIAHPVLTCLIGALRSFAPRGRSKSSVGARWGAAVRPVITAVSFLVLVVPAHAETARLESVIQQALNGNLTLLKAKTDIDAAKGELLKAKSAFDWTAFAQTGWQRFYVPKSRNGVLTDQIGTVDAWHTTVGFSKEFSNGISINPGVSSFITPGVTVGQALGYTQTTPSLDLTIPLDRGLGRSSADAAERAAQFKVDASRSQYEFVAQMTVHDVVQIFWRCLAANQERKIVADTDRDESDYANWLGQMVRSGQAEPVSLNLAKARAALDDRNLADADQAVYTCRRNLADAIGLSAPQMLEPAGELPNPDRFVAAIGRLKEEVLIQLALDQRRDLAALKQEVAAAKALVVSAEDQLNPKIDLVLDPLTVYLRYSQSLNRYSAHGAIASARANQSAAEIALLQRQHQIGDDIDHAVRELRTLARNWPSLVSAQRNYLSILQDTEKRVRVGTLGRDQLLQAQSDLAQSRRAVIDTQVKLASVLASLRLETGRIHGESPEVLAAEFVALPTP